MKQATGFVTTDNKFFPSNQKGSAKMHQLRLDIEASYERYEEDAALSINTAEAASHWILKHAGRIHQALCDYLAEAEEEKE